MQVSFYAYLQRQHRRLQYLIVLKLVHFQSGYRRTQNRRQCLLTFLKLKFVHIDGQLLPRQHRLHQLRLKLVETITIQQIQYQRQVLVLLP